MGDLVVTFLASFLIWFLFLGLGVLWIIDGRIKKEQVIHALSAVLISWIIVEIIKNFFPTFRPYVFNLEEVGVFVKPIDSSFPSTHAAAAFALSMTIFMHDRRVGSLFLASAFAIGIARVIANVHFPLDILGGAFVGTLVAVVVEKAHLFKLIRRGG